MSSLDQTISRGRAYVRLIEAVDVLLAGEAGGQEAALLHQVRRLATARLRALVAELPPEMAAQILAASDKLAAPVSDVSKN